MNIDKLTYKIYKDWENLFQSISKNRKNPIVAKSNPKSKLDYFENLNFSLKPVEIEH